MGATETVAARARWNEAVRGPLSTEADEAVHWAVFRDAFTDWPLERGPPPAWGPDHATIERANLTELAQERGLEGYDAVWRWSVTDRAGFWGHVAAGFGLHPAGAVLEGPPDDPRWFPGTTWNAVLPCFRWPADRPALRIGREADGPDTVRDVSFGELKALADRVSHGLLSRGLQAGDAVALYMPMDLSCVAAYLGIVQAGMAVVSIPDSFAPAEVATRLRLGNARAVVTVASFRRGGRDVAMLPKAREAAGDRLLVVVGDAPEGGLGDGEVAWDDLLVDGGPFAPVEVPVDHVSNVLFSSGTTGEPKAIPWTHLTPLKAMMDGRYHQDIHAGDVVAWPTNIGWMMGPWLLYATLANGATVALWEGAPNTRDFLAFVEQAGTTMLGVVPALVRAWREAGVPPHSLSTVRVLSSTGEASQARDYLHLMSLASYRAPVIEYCGGTEVGGGHLTGSVLQPQSPATFSTPALGIDLVVLDDDGQPVAPGGMGEVFLVPPSVGLSQRLLNRDHHAVYHAECPPGPNGEVLRRHGDEVQVLHGGYWRAQGRADDTMNLGGIKVGSVELETVVNGHPGVRESAAVGIVPPGGGADRLVLFVVPAAGTTPDATALRPALQQRIKEQLNPLFRVHDVVLVDALPRTASNKVLRRELRAAHAG